MQTIDKETTIDYADKDMFNRKYITNKDSGITLNKQWDKKYNKNNWING